MPGQSVATIIGGPCLITYRGGTFRSKGDVRLNMELTTFAIETSLYGQVDERVSEHPLVLSFEPDGEWTNLPVLWPYASTPFGTFITPQVPVASIGSNQMNVGSTAVLLSGDDIVFQVQGNGSIANGITAGNVYYLHVVDASHISIHTTYANAVAGVNPVAISAGTGNTIGVINNPLTIQSLDGYLWTFYNAAVSKMPALRLSTVQTAVGPVEFNCYLADGQDWNTGSSLYNITANPYPGDTGFNPSSILTGEIQAVWRNMVAPWSLFDTKNGWEVDFAMSLERVEVDNVGLVTHRLSNLVVTAKAQPLGVNINDVATAMLLQGSGSFRGRSLAATGNDLLLSATANNLGCKIFNAALRGGPAQWSNKLDRIGQLTWIATRTFSSTGPNPLFSIGNTQVT